MAGWASAFGVQLFGIGELLEPGPPDWELGITIFKYPASLLPPIEYEKIAVDQPAAA